MLSSSSILTRIDSMLFVGVLYYCDFFSPGISMGVQTTEGSGTPVQSIDVGLP